MRAGPLLCCAVLAACSRSVSEDRSSSGQAGKPPPPVTAVEAKGELTNSVAGTITVSWTPPLGVQPAIGKYEVRGEGFAFVADVGLGTSASDVGVPPGSMRCYRVYALNASGWSPPAPSPTCATVPGARPPGPPRNVRATAISRGALVEWDAPELDGPLVYDYVIDFGPDLIFASVQQTGLSATVVGLRDGHTYTFAVPARNAAGSSAPAQSNPVTVRTIWPSGTAWSQGPSVAGQFRQAAFVAGDTLYLVTASEVLASHLDAGGRPAAWTSIGQRPGVGSGSSSSAALYSPDGRSGFLYLTGGGEVPNPNLGKAWAAPLRPDGSIGAFTETSSIDPGPSHHATAVHGRHLYVAGGNWWSGGSYTGIGSALPFVHVAEIAADGSLGPWRRTATLPRPALWRTALVGDRLYALTEHGAGTGADVVYADLLPDGSVTRWKRATAQLGHPYSAFALAAEAGRLYVLGGTRLYGEFTNAVAVGQIGPDGDVVGWEVSDADAFNGPRGGAVAAAGSGHIYLIGGTDLARASVQSGGTFYDVQWATIDPATGHLAPLSRAAAAPGAPLGVEATAGDASATVRWTRPRDPGDAPISGYTVSGRPLDLSGQLTQVDVEADGNATSATVTGLRNGTSYTFEVTARNASGTGARSGPTVDVTPSPSRVWRPVPVIGSNLFDPRTLLVPGDVLFLLGNARLAAGPLDGDGIPWGQLGPGYQGSYNSHWNSWAQASRPSGNGAACAYRLGGRSYFGPDAETVAITRYDCLRADGFFGKTLDYGFAKEQLPITRMNGAAAAIGSFLYALGGTHVEGGVSRNLDDVSVTRFLDDGEIGPWSAAIPLPGPMASPAIAVRANDIYPMPPAGSAAAVLRATSRADGSLSAWTSAGASIPTNDSPARAIAAGDFLYVLAGESLFIGQVDAASRDVISWERSDGDAPVPVADLAATTDRLYLWSGAHLHVARIDLRTGGLLRW